MARRETRIWEGDPRSGLSRKDRAGGSYEVYVPDPLAGRRFLFDADAAADVSDAERAIVQLDARSSAPADTEALARLLLRAESVASSKIEGLEVGARRLLRADAARASGENENDVTAAEVLGNIDAMTYALQSVKAGTKITLPLLLKVHRHLLEGTDLKPHAGKIRTRQNWIGGSSHNPCSAVFVPPPPEMVETLFLDLCAFCNDDSLPPVVQAALAHAQFENIHPFADGNGRVGRALIHMVFRRRALTQRVSPPVSLVLATRSKDYLEGLRATAYIGDPGGRDAVAGMNRWVGTFAAACTRAVTDALRFETRITQVQDQWRDRLGPVRSDAAAVRLIDALPGAPVITLAAAQKIIDRSLRATIDGMQRLVDAGIVKPIDLGRRRKQIYEAREIIDVFTALERQLASPAGDTKIEPPTRRVPSRR
ncbi:MAG TPA: Fic family protein [Candidatus Baltobacteraceae bacterium]|nr:Fic family protein [Candidatus Baltobacteraceae bacterium]